MIEITANKIYVLLDLEIKLSPAGNSYREKLYTHLIDMMDG
jgi:hypothetical protein